MRYLTGAAISGVAWSILPRSSRALDERSLKLVGLRRGVEVTRHPRRAKAAVPERTSSPIGRSGTGSTIPSRPRPYSRPRSSCLCPSWDLDRRPREEREPPPGTLPQTASFSGFPPRRAAKSVPSWTAVNWIFFGGRRLRGLIRHRSRLCRDLRSELLWPLARLPPKPPLPSQGRWCLRRGGG
jgi:hypothetical protein